VKIPPSTVMTWPVIPELRGSARDAARSAISLSSSDPRMGTGGGTEDSVRAYGRSSDQVSLTPRLADAPATAAPLRRLPIAR
jgi:hypothetical protein